MPPFPSQRSLDSRFRGNDRLRRATASAGMPPSAEPRSPSSPPTRHSRLSVTPAYRHSHPPVIPAYRHPRPPVILTHQSSPPSTIPPHLSFPRKRESTAPPSFPEARPRPRSGTRNPRPPGQCPPFPSQRSLDSRFRGNDGSWSSPPSTIPPRPVIPRLPPSPPTCHSRENGNPLRLHHSPKLVPDPDPDRGPGTQGCPSNASLPIAMVPRFPLSRE